MENNDCIIDMEHDEKYWLKYQTHTGTVEYGDGRIYNFTVRETLRKDKFTSKIKWDNVPADKERLEEEIFTHERVHF